MAKSQAKGGQNQPYTVQWSELPVPLIPSREQQGPEKVWVVFSDDAGFGQALLSEMRAYGQLCVVVRPGFAFAEVEQDNFRIRSHAIDDYHSLFEWISERHDLAGIIHLWSNYSIESQGVSDTEFLLAHHQLSCTSLMYIVQALDASKLKRMPSIFVASWSLQEEGDEVSLLQWPLTAVCKAVGNEFPEFDLRRISLDLNDKLTLSVNSLVLELWSDDREDQITWRHGKRYGPRLVRLAPPARATVELDAERSYVIVADSRWMQHLVDWYLNRGARHLILMSPDPITDDLTSYLTGLSEEQISVYHRFSLDTSSLTEMELVIFEALTTFPPVHGTLFDAVRVPFKTTGQLSSADFSESYADKVRSAWNLHHLSKKWDLDHFILVASIGPMMDPRPVALRAAADAFMGALAYHRVKNELPAVCVDFGPITENLDPNLASLPQGLSSASKESALQGLDQALALQLPELVLAVVDWKAFLSSSVLARPLFINREVEAGLRPPEIIARYRSVRVDERDRVILNFVRSRCRRLSKRGSLAPLDDKESLSKQGLDAQLLMDLEQSLRAGLGDQISLAPGFVKQESSTMQIAQHLKEALELSGVTEAPTTARGDAAPIAVVGIACRFPGEIGSAEELWDVVGSGVSFESRGSDPSYRRLDRAESFDYAYFKLSKEDANSWDTRQRLCLELVVHAIEDAGIPFNRLRGHSVGLFMGSNTAESRLADSSKGCQRPGALSLELARLFDFIGPCIDIEAAVSSSLLPISQACLHLQSGACNMALVGAFNLFEGDLEDSQPLCEGAGILVLKPLSDAIRDRDRIRGVIRGAATNQCGSRAAETDGAHRSRQQLVTHTLQSTDTDVTAVDFVELSVVDSLSEQSDQIETLDVLYGRGRSPERPVYLGSIRASLGDLGAVSSMAGLIKCLLALEHHAFPAEAMRDCGELNDKEGGLKVLTKGSPWLREAQRVRCAAVNTFDARGFNGHVIVTELPPILAPATAKPIRIPKYPIQISAKTEAALETLLGDFELFLDRENPLRIEDLAFSTCCGRDLDQWATLIFAADVEELRSILAEKRFETVNRSELVELQVYFTQSKSSERTAKGYMVLPLSETRNEWQRLMRMLQDRFVSGDRIHWSVLFKSINCRKIGIPKYPFC